MIMMVLSTIASADEFTDRTGWNFGVGIAALAGCDKENDYTDENGVVDKGEHFCLVIPVLDLSVGYGFTPQFKMSLETKSLLAIGIIGLKAQYYTKDKKDTMYWYAEAETPYFIGGFEGKHAVGSIGIGYAKGHAEYDVGLLLTGKDTGLVLSAKYNF